jgi:lipopolysaccharide transport system permease protein
MTAQKLTNHETPAAMDQFDLWIEAGHTEKHYWLDLWRYRELFLILAWRDVMIRYKQTVAGAVWAVLQPLVGMVIMTILFSRVAGLPSDGAAPYAVMVFAAMLPWQLFANSLSSASQSMVNSSNLISKIYFPRLIVPASSIIISLVDFGISLAILVGVMGWYQFWPTWRLLTLPFWLIMAIIAALGPGLIMTALLVKYRDFRFLIPVIVQFGMYVSPVAYSSAVIRSKLGEKWSLVYSLNPVAGVIDGFRWAVLGGASAIHWSSFAVSCVLTLALLFLGIYYFRKTERIFADII